MTPTQLNLQIFLKTTLAAQPHTIVLSKTGNYLYLDEKEGLKLRTLTWGCGQGPGATPLRKIVAYINKIGLNLTRIDNISYNLSIGRINAKIHKHNANIKRRCLGFSFISRFFEIRELPEKN